MSADRGRFASSQDRPRKDLDVSGDVYLSDFVDRSPDKANWTRGHFEGRARGGRHITLTARLQDGRLQLDSFAWKARTGAPLARAALGMRERDWTEDRLGDAVVLFLRRTGRMP